MTTFALVSLEESKRHLRIEISDHDADVQLKTDAGCSIVMNYLKLTSLPDEWCEPLGSPSGTGVPPLVKSATLLVVGELYKNREATVADVLSMTVKSMLDRYRDPTLA